MRKSIITGIVLAVSLFIAWMCARAGLIRKEGVGGLIFGALYFFGPVLLAIAVFIFGKGFRRRISSQDYPHFLRGIF